jgi:hypothetical protein
VLWCHLGKHRVELLSDLPLTNRSEVGSNDTHKTREFRHMEPRACGVEEFEIKLVLENLCYLLGIPACQTEFRIIEPGKQIIGMALIIVENDVSGLLVRPDM